MASRQVLDSWKEISAYLNRSVMTCQRWERQLNLPVHRLDGTPRARVFAYPDELDRWLAEKLHIAEAEAVSSRPSAHPRGRWALISMASIAFVGVFAAAVWRLIIQPPLAAPAQVPSLAVLPFENRTGDPAWDGWKMALPDLITIDLRQSKFLDVIKTSDLYQAVGPLAEAEKFSAQDLRTVAEKANVDYAVTGSFVKSGQGVVITTLVQNARTGDVAGSARSACRAEKRVFSSVDDLSREIKAALNASPREIRGDIDRSVARITTTSPQAFAFYSQAYRIQGKRKFEDAIAPLQKAVELDPQFGLAYRLLYWCCVAQSREEDRKKYVDHAVRLAGRIMERERALLLINFYESEQPDRERYIRAFQRLGKNYPYDPAMTGLARFYMGQEEWDKAVPILEKLISRYPKRDSVLSPLLTSYQCLGLYEKAEELIDQNLGEDPQPERGTIPLWPQRVNLALAQKKFDIAHDLLDLLIADSPDNPSYPSQKGFVYFLQDDLPNAEKMYQRLVANERPRIQISAFEYLAAVSLSRGRVEEAKQRIRRAIELTKGLEDYGPDMERPYRSLLAYLERLSGRLPEALREAELSCEGVTGGPYLVKTLYLKALITIEMNRFEEFEKQAKEIKRYLEYLGPDRVFTGAPRFMRVYDNLLGHRELQKKNYDLAIQYFWKALDLLSPLAAESIDADHAKYYFDLAEAYRRAGSLPDAVKMYEKVVLPTVSREFSGDLYAKSYYWMGVNAEQWMRSTTAPDRAGERRLEAVGHYRKFLELWGDADPIFPEVPDARMRLARLETR